MICLVTGGSTSGKSAMAEEIAKRLNTTRYYIATMMCYDEESKERIKRHKAMREGKNFITIEQCKDIGQIRYSVDPFSCVLIECMSNLLANELFTEETSETDEVTNTEKTSVSVELEQHVNVKHREPYNLFIANKILCDINELSYAVENIVIVSNEVFSDAIAYDTMTMDYIKALGSINEGIAKNADVVIEAVYGIPVYHKGKEQLLL